MARHPAIGNNGNVARKECRLETSASPTPPPTEGVGPKPWGLPAVLLALALPLLIWGSALALNAIEGAREERLPDSAIVTGLIITIILDLILIGLAAGLSIWRYRLGWDALGLRPFGRDVWWWPLAGAGAAHVGIFAYALVLIAIGADAAAPAQEDLEELFESRAVLPLTGIATVLMAPLAEEIFFRGFVFAGLIRPFGLPGAMAASGLLFGAFHVAGPETVGLVLPFAVIGVLFAWIYYRTGSLWLSIGTHLLFNLVSFIAQAAMAGSGSG